MIYTFDPPDDSEWTLSGSAEITASYVPVSDPNVLFLFARRSTLLGNRSSAASRTFAVTPGQVYPVRMWLNGDNGGSIDLTLTLTDSSGSTVFTLSPAVGFGWQLSEPTAYTAVGTHVTVTLTTPTPSGGGGGLGTSGNWLIDDFELEGSLGDFVLSKWGAINGSITVLKSILGSGDGYNTDLGNRVYTRLFLPTEQPDMVKPYVCLPLDQESEQLEYEGFAFTSSWRMVGHAFFDDNQESDPLDSDGSIQAAKFRDDLIRAFMADQTLGGQALNCIVTAIETASGVIEDGVAEVIFTVEFTQMGAASDLEVA